MLATGLVYNGDLLATGLVYNNKGEWPGSGCRHLTDAGFCECRNLAPVFFLGGGGYCFVVVCPLQE